MRILLLTAGTGYGHISAATALAEAFAGLTGNEHEIVTAAPLGQAVDDCYGWMLTRAPAAWGACYKASDSRVATAMGNCLLQARYARRFAGLVARVQPQAIISVHALCTQIASEYLRTTGRAIPLFCVVTDLVDIHRSWVADNVHLYLAATEEAAAAIKRLAAFPARIHVTGIPLRQAFWLSPAGTRKPAWPRVSSPGGQRRESERGRRLRLLVMDGGMPGPQLPGVLRNLTEAGVSLEIVAAWGRCAPESRRYEIAGAHKCTVCHLARGEAIEPAMRSADIVVTKAGSLTIAEALAVGRPILVHRAAPGQERSNPLFVQRAGAGIAVPSRTDLVEAIRVLAASSAIRKAMGRRAKEHGRPAAALDVASLILGSLGVATNSRLA
jgi:processive 1,2-diacylglycerol beta-glucosyltransferase